LIVEALFFCEPVGGSAIFFRYPGKKKIFVLLLGYAVCLGFIGHICRIYTVSELALEL